MGNLRDGLLPVLDTVRGVAGILGLRNTAVTVRVVSWTGARQGLGTSSFVDTKLLVKGQTQNPRVKQLTARDVFASGGVYSTQDVRVGPLTPSFPLSAFVAAGGVALGTVNPPPPTAGSVYQEIFWKVEGGGFLVPRWFVLFGDDLVSPTRYFVVLRRCGNQQPGGAP
jgi:hypothetical protein